MNTESKLIAELTEGVTGGELKPTAKQFSRKHHDPKATVVVTFDSLVGGLLLPKQPYHDIPGDAHGAQITTPLPTELSQTIVYNLPMPLEGKGIWQVSAGETCYYALGVKIPGGTFHNAYLYVRNFGTGTTRFNIFIKRIGSALGHPVDIPQGEWLIAVEAHGIVPDFSEVYISAGGPSFSLGIDAVIFA